MFTSQFIFKRLNAKSAWRVAIVSTLVLIVRASDGRILGGNGGGDGGADTRPDEERIWTSLLLKPTIKGDWGSGIR
jgi:hypothetical protein